MHVGNTVFVQKNDKLGFTNIEDESVITHTQGENDQGSETAYRPEDNTTQLDTGQSYLFDQTLDDYKFSVNVVIDTGKYVLKGLKK